MSFEQFPANDRFWVEVADFIAKLGISGQIFAPLEFTSIFPNRVISYQQVNRVHITDKVSVFVLHKGRLDQLPKSFLKKIHNELRPIFANEVFVIFSSIPNIPAVDSSNQHLVSYYDFFSRAHPPLVASWKRRIASLVERVWAKLFMEPMMALVRAEVQSIEAKLLASQEVIQHKMRPMVYLGDHLALTRTVMGHKMIVDTRDLSLSYHILMDGLWEPWVTKVIRETVKPGWNIIEVGANIGWYSVLLASLIGKDGRLWVFEPNPRIYHLLCINLEINGFLDRAVAVNKAVLDRSGMVEFGVAGRHMGGSGVFTFGSELEPVERITVEAVSLDEYLPPKTRVNLLKIDAEGSEFYILKGAERIIKENPEMIIIMEFIPNNVRGSGLDPGEFLRSLVREGYRVLRISEAGDVREASVDEVLALEYSELYLVRRLSGC